MKFSIDNSRLYQLGNAAIEFAFALPIFLAMLMGIIEINRYYWTGYWLNYALHQAVRAEALDPGIGVLPRIKTSIQDVLLDPTRIELTENLEVLSDLDLDKITVRYSTVYFLLPSKILTVEATTWSYFDENTIQ